MYNQFSRIGGTLALAAILAAVGSQGSLAQRSRKAGSGMMQASMPLGASHSETTLLGVTLLKSSFRDVLKRYGRPDEIQAGGPFVPLEGAPASRGTGGPGGQKGTSKTGFLGASGTGASAPSGGGPGMAGGSPYPGGGGGSPYPGGGGGGLPGFSSPDGGMGMAGKGGGGGMAAMNEGGNSGSGGASGGSEGSESQPEYEATWWYHDKKNGLHKSFLFNKDGRVVQIQEYGHDKNHKGSKTRLGVGLGSNLNTVLRNYGWSNDGANDGMNIILRFGGEDKVAFQLVNNIVLGITIAVVKDAPPAEAP